MNQPKLGFCLTLAVLAVSCSEAAVNVEASKTYPTSEAIKSIPLPPSGQRWVINEQFSDEFNGTELDDTKWYDYHPSWVGREPGLFEPENVEVSGGMLRLWGKKMTEPKTVNGTEFNISCSAVVSKTQEAHYGYYESRFKANRTGLSTTFWLSSRGSEGQFPIEGNQPADAVTKTGKYSQELDIFECIGYDGGTTGSNGTAGDKKMAGGMNSNVHYWYTPTGGTKYDARIEEAVLKLPNNEKPTDDFNVYGCWWRDKSNVSFYLNNDQESAMHRECMGRNHPVTDNNWNYDIEFYMSKPMGLNMVVETYPYPWVTLPLDTHLADRERSTTLYDWVRAYILVGSDEQNPKTNAAPMTMFENKIHLPEKQASHDSSVALSVPIHYTASTDLTIMVAIYDASGKMVYDDSITALAGYSNTQFAVSKMNWANSGEQYTLVAYLSQNKRKANEEYISGDSYIFSIK